MLRRQHGTPSANNATVVGGMMGGGDPSKIRSEPRTHESAGIDGKAKGGPPQIGMQHSEAVCQLALDSTLSLSLSVLVAFPQS